MYIGVRDMRRVHNVKTDVSITHSYQSGRKHACIAVQALTRLVTSTVSRKLCIIWSWIRDYALSFFYTVHVFMLVESKCRDRTDAIRLIELNS